MKSCKYCGEELTDTEQHFYPVDECFSCGFWSGNYEHDKRGGVQYAIINGHHYLIEPDEPGVTSGFLGFAGAEVKIEFIDGTRVVTRNLWHQGQIPPPWRQSMPDNAKFITSP